jgi:hypothetical protein
MASDFDSSEPSVLVEMVERRGELRGLACDVQVAIGDLEPCPAVEMSRKGVFVAVREPDVFPLGQMYALTIWDRERRLSCRAEVVRKETEPRRGIALRIDVISPDDEAALVAILDAL